MLSTFEPHPLLRNGHLQTVAAVLWRRSFSLPQSEERLFEVEPGTRLRGWCHWQAGKSRAAPVLVIVHGLEGSSESGYMLGIAQDAFAAGFHVVRMNQRNCGGSEALTPTLYNSGMSGDYRAILRELADGDGFEQVFFAGYSMGGNLVLKMAGELGDAAPVALRGVCAVCPALDLAACADALSRPDNFFYQMHFVRGLMNRYARKVRLFPDRYPRDGFGPIRSVREFDDKITAPQFGFRSAQDYYTQSSAQRVVSRIRVPTLILTAQDDPFVPHRRFLELDLSQNPAITFIAPRHGGHCAFISRHPGQARFWAESAAVSFCQAQQK